MAQTHHCDSGKTLVINNATDEDGYLKIFGKDIDVIRLGDSTHEGGDVSIYEDASNHKSFSFDADTGNLILGNISSETASLQIFGKNADALILGDTTHEGGDIKMFRDTSGNLQLFVDADAASNAIAMSIYGGVVAQNFLTVGSTTLQTGYPLYVTGAIYASTNITVGNDIYAADGLYGGTAGGVYTGTAGFVARSENQPAIPITIPISGTDSIDHAIQLQIDANNIIEVKATGDGSGGIINKAIGVFGVTPQVRQAHIADPTDLATCITALSTLLADMEGYGWLLDS